MLCTCGRIRRPRGASLSIGTTSTASSPGLTRSPRIDGLSMKSGGAASSSAWRKSSTPRPSLAAVSTGVILRSCRRLTGAGRLDEVALVEDDDDGRLALEELVEDAVLELAPAAGLGDEHAEVGAVEHLHGASCARSSPSAPTSSMPAVSMKSTGPSGSSSIGFSTGSVVVPAKSLTMLRRPAG